MELHNLYSLIIFFHFLFIFSNDILLFRGQLVTTWSVWVITTCLLCWFLINYLTSCPAVSPLLLLFCKCSFLIYLLRLFSLLKYSRNQPCGIFYLFMNSSLPYGPLGIPVAYLKAHLNPRVVAVVCFCFEMLYCPNAWSYWLYELKRFMRVSSTTRAGGKEYSWSLIAFSLDSRSNKWGGVSYMKTVPRCAIHLGWMWAFKGIILVLFASFAKLRALPRLVIYFYPPSSPSATFYFAFLTVLWPPA